MNMNICNVESFENNSSECICLYFVELGILVTKCEHSDFLLQKNFFGSNTVSSFTTAILNSSLKVGS